MENNILYLDCNRSFASIKEEVNRNIWTNEFDSIFIPKGSQISIQNALVNIQGIEGGSIEIRDDEEINMGICFYISHSNYPMPKFQYNDPMYQNAGDIWFDRTNLNTLYRNTFTENNTHNLFSSALKTKIDTSFNWAISNSGAGLSTSIYDLIVEDDGETQTFGGLEIPLFACKVTNTGFLEPLVKNVRIKIPKGTYGITQLSDLITSQLVGRQAFDKDSPNTILPTTDVLVNSGDFGQSHLKSQCTENVAFWNYEYTIGGATNSNFGTIISELAQNDIAQFHTITQSAPIYIMADKFQTLMNNFRTGNISDANYQVEQFFVTDGNYVATLKNKERNPGPVQNKGTPPLYYIKNDDPNITPFDTTGTFDNYLYANDPYANGYYIGSNSITFEYDTTSAGFSFKSLHTSRQENSHDMLGNVLTNEGQNVSHIKDNTNPRSRATGICVYNWDKDVISRNIKIGIQQSELNYGTWQDIFSSRPDEMNEIWTKSLWYRLGFDFGRLNTNIPVRVNDLQMATFGITTNNQLDSSIIQSMCSQTSGSQSTSNTDYINTNMPQTLLKQLKTNDIFYHQGTLFGVNVNSYKIYKNCMYFYAGAFSIVTDSVSLTASRLPVLSDEGYFLITSDVVGAMNDVVKKKQPIPLLGIVPKSNLSNQDFINSLQEITHITQQDRVLNQIKFGIYNADLTSPQLNEKSSIILKIVKNPQVEAQEEKQEKKIEKITSNLPQ